MNISRFLCLKNEKYFSSRELKEYLNLLLKLDLIASLETFILQNGTRLKIDVLVAERSG